MHLPKGLPQIEGNVTGRTEIFGDHPGRVNDEVNRARHQRRIGEAVVSTARFRRKRLPSNYRRVTSNPPALVQTIRYDAGNVGYRRPSRAATPSRSTKQSKQRSELKAKAGETSPPFLVIQRYLLLSAPAPEISELATPRPPAALA
jgi:hypothetical protein